MRYHTNVESRTLRNAISALVFAAAAVSRFAHAFQSPRRILLRSSVLSSPFEHYAVMTHQYDQESSSLISDDSCHHPHLVFPGGGIFFYWQAGVISYLREQEYDTTSVTSTGASAGALTATLTASGVDFYKATQLALDLAAEAGVWDRQEGLQGIWGPMIHDWLDELLPEDAVERCNRGLSLLVTPFPNIFGPKDCISEFNSKEDLIQCNMASVHLPWFLDGKLTANFRDRPHIDGSFLASAKTYENCPDSADRTVSICYSRDPVYQSRSLLEAVEALSPDGIWGLLEDGKRYAKFMEENGEFEMLSKVS